MSLTVIPAEPANESVIETLEEALAKARAGKISSIGIAMVFRDGATGTSWSRVPSIGTLIGSACLLVQRLSATVKTGSEP